MYEMSVGKRQLFQPTIDHEIAAPNKAINSNI